MTARLHAFLARLDPDALVFAGAVIIIILLTSGVAG